MEGRCAMNQLRSVRLAADFKTESIVARVMSAHGLRKVVQGYYQYHAAPANTGQLRVFRRRVCRLWRSVLIRRSQRAQVGWDRLYPLLSRWIPRPRVLHPYPMARFAVTHPW